MSIKPHNFKTASLEKTDKVDQKFIRLNKISSSFVSYRVPPPNSCAFLPLEAPIPHRPKDRLERFSLFCEPVGEMFSPDSCRDAFGNFLRNEPFETRAEDVRWDAFRRTNKILESGSPEKQISHHKQSPTITDKIESACNRTK